MALTFDVIVAGLEAVGVPRHRAEERARVECGLATPGAERDATIDEKREQVEVRKRFVVCGFQVYNLSQPRATKQTPGLPDLFLVHRSLPIALWWESKRQVGGKLSPAQLEFAEACTRCAVGYGTGDRFDAERHLVSIGRATLICGVFEPVLENHEAVQ